MLEGAGKGSSKSTRAVPTRYPPEEPLAKRYYY